MSDGEVFLRLCLIPLGVLVLSYGLGAIYDYLRYEIKNRK
ncbi:hypothetical protein HCTV-8_gp56 [Haloarcula virus HCTV-8]|jgi:hypothetical protein|uniref:Uncharacterized protein n=5 Tax=Haloferacalesvirus TaxID=2843389 RepID=A0AAE8XUQ1_9CAUD|nr:minor head protein [Halorubrum tailed phage 5]UBF20383.1 hypothetical protein HCTV-7_gp58 [Haloarcula phage HCTV-7]UBF20499.1 hypothetical protein HCTV-9_gp58 [Haloarcula phage HCTV-9]UBF20615.1 hypothetical protein HCTV-11_gp58 [Haloarcula phage HCTV-11]UBF20844.1 hypothetical protein HRTV-16_gp58 [Halorubrum virus HRTV-16]UBF20955.1 hypothetical protein HCTV-8_gp56 [Haloarcula virus HCTV-8]UBF21067.1 hypothetical protein HCTV-10_gp56 [Haloarcula virus HCTV-10]UBF21181.1 hypothetical pro